MYQCAQQYGDTLPANVEQALLYAACELKASEEGSATVVEQKRALQRRLPICESNLCAALEVPTRAKP